MCSACILKTRINLTILLLKSKFLSFQICDSTHILSRHYHYYNYHFCFYLFLLIFSTSFVWLFLIFMFCNFKISLILLLLSSSSSIFQSLFLSLFIIIVIILIIILVLSLLLFYFWSNSSFSLMKWLRWVDYFVCLFVCLFFFSWNCRVIISNFITFLPFQFSVFNFPGLQFSSFIFILT